MTLTSGASASPADRISVERLGDAVLFLTVASSSIVLIEPAPYDVLLSLHALVAFALGLALPRAMAPLVVLILLYDVGGLLSVTQVRWWEGAEHGHPFVFVAISVMLMVHVIFLAATCAEKPHRLDLIVKATIVAAVITALLGIAGFALDLEIFTLYGRAKGGFKDPNVFGPFLVLPLIFLARRMMVGGLVRHWREALWAALLLAGIFLSMSRAAWGLTAGALVMLGLVLFVDERSARGRLRLALMGLLGVAAVILLLAAVLSFDGVRNLFGERAQLVQNYDGERLGRFARHLLGFLRAAELPLGDGPYQFAHVFTEDPHNIFLKSLMVYGWLGFVAYTALAVWTITALFRSMFLPRPWKPLAQVVWVTLAGHMVVGWIIDTDHWRHFFLLWGLAWAMIALEKCHAARRRRAAVLPA